MPRARTVRTRNAGCGRPSSLKTWVLAGRVKLADRLSNIRVAARAWVQGNHLGEKDSRLLSMYRNEHPAFMDALSALSDGPLYQTLLPLFDGVPRA